VYVKLSDDIVALRKSTAEVKLPPDLESRVLADLEEVSRLENDISARVHIEQILRYIDWIVHLPWHEYTNDILDLVKAKELLDHNHTTLPVKRKYLNIWRY